MNVDIRQYTRIIIRKNNEYLQCISGMCGCMVWNTSPWDAWWTRDINVAKEIAMKTGGIMILFNPIARQMKIL